MDDYRYNDAPCHSRIERAARRFARRAGVSVTETRAAARALYHAHDPLALRAEARDWRGVFELYAADRERFARSVYSFTSRVEEWQCTS